MNAGPSELLFVFLLSFLTPTDVEPQPPDAIVAGLADDCEVLAYVDFRGGPEGLQNLLDDLSRRPWVTGYQETAEALVELNSGLEQARDQMVAQFGFGPEAVHSISFCAAIPDGLNPEFVAVVQGEFPQSAAATLASAVEIGTVTLSNGVTVFGERDELLVGFASPADGQLVFGTEGYLATRAVTPLSSDFSAAAPDSLVAQVLAHAAENPRGLIALRPSEPLRTLIQASAPYSLYERVAGLDHGMFLWNASGSVVDVMTTNDDAFRDYDLIVSGASHALQASPHLVRAYAAMLLGVLSADDPDLDDFLRVLVRHRNDVMTFLDATGLVADVEVAYASDPATRQISLRATGSTPLPFLGLLGAGMFYLVRVDSGSDSAYMYEGAQEVEAEPVMMDSPPPAPAPPPARAMPPGAAPDSSDDGSFVGAPGGF